MAGRLLFVILIYSFHKIQTRDLLPPTLTVNPPVITETDSVTLHCQTPPSLSVSHCYFYTLSGGTTLFPCLKTLTGTELLQMSQQSSPAEVQVKCYYTVKHGDVNYPSPHSDPSSITVCQKPEISIQHFPGENVLFTCTLPGSADRDARCNLYFGENNNPVPTTTSWKNRDSKNRLICQFTVTIDDFLRRVHFLKRHDASCDYSLGNEANSLSPRSDGYSLTDIVEKEPSKISAFTTPPDIVEKDTHLTKTMLTSTMTTETVSSVNPGPDKDITGSSVSTPGIKDSSNTAAPQKTASAEIWKFVAVVAGCGVTVGVILLVSAILCNNRRTAGSQEVKGRQEHHNENMETYHMYAAISEEPAASDLKSIMYSTVQSH
ncbi:uncharacterized protein LOC117489707 isoform X2 [Trematomus bernacchii]|uniref:uncharacterized protein LOC117489707 isoform X2 n=1 Tax=Trematomus bernacchii TaxID=40690 RepID=UPI00146CD31A|nr:uncharacterized protein LOC117489707 isoform X2 [Trematomus bernacchii]